MKVCSECGSQVSDQYTTCPNCGSMNLTVQNNIQPQMSAYQQPVYNQPIQNQNGNIGWGILGFFIPIAGLVMYLVWKDTNPADSLIAGKGALISVIVSMGLCILYIAFIVLMFVISLVPLIFNFM